MEEVIIYFSKETELISQEEMNLDFLKLPKMISERIRKYDDPLTQQLKLKGKLLLIRLLERFHLPFLLEQLCFTNANRPYFHSDFYFNISYSGNIVICGGLKNGRIGIDIEKIKPIDINLFKNYFSLDEWQIIIESENNLSAFYRFWTRKEALAKAIGSGVLKEFSELEVINDMIETQECRYFLHEIIICEGYIASMAVVNKNVRVTITE